MPFFFFFLGLFYLTIFSSPLPLTLFFSHPLMHLYFYLFHPFFLSLGQFSWDGFTGPLPLR